MEVILGKTAGFCHGVTRAVEEAESIIENSNTIYCLGDLVHNEQVISKLRKKGLKVIENIEEAPKHATVIIRAHGVPNKVYIQAEQKEIKLVDLTCVKVLNIHKQAKEYANQGYYIFLIAEKKHPETIGTISFCGQDSYIIQESEDIDCALDQWKKSKKQKLLILSQTTFSLTKFDKIVSEITSKLDSNIEVEIKKTICNATNLRQKETKELAQTVDCMIIIGGTKSSNTRKLYEIAKENCNDTIFIQTKEDLAIEKIRKYHKIGVMAGASTPKESIEDVIQWIERDKVCI